MANKKRTSTKRKRTEKADRKDLSPVRESSDKVIAILCADMHLSLKPPRARREEGENWFKAMKKPFDHLSELSSKYKAPILCAGDIFNHWKAEPAVINFALQYMPEMYAIPGQHDLPLHNIDLIEKSAFWTLCLEGRIIPVMGEPEMARNGIIIHGFPWGRKLEPLKKKIKGKYHIAIAHEFFYKKGYEHPKAPRTQHMSYFKKLVTGYHAVVFGDNHKGFKSKVNGVPVWNCGSLMRRNSDQKEYSPRIGLLFASGNIATHYISKTNEKFKSTEEDFEGTYRRPTEDLSDLLHGLREVSTENIDFIDAIEFLMQKYSVNNKVRKHIMEAVDRD